MFRAFFSHALKRGQWLVMLAGLAAFAVSFGALIVFATGWAAAVIPTISETVLNAILAALIAQFAMSLTHALLRLNIGVAAEAARRVELAAQYIGAQGSGFTTQLRQLAMSILSDRRMPESVKTVIEKVRSWSHAQSSAKSHTRQQCCVYEFGR
jgi:hypothetical protein